MISSSRTQISRKCTYLTQSRHGIFVFRWNVLIDGKHHQPRISLKTRDYLDAISIAAELARSIRKLHNPSVEQIKKVYQEFTCTKEEEKKLLSEIDVASLLRDLTPKSQAEYISCWRSFVASLCAEGVPVSDIAEEHIESWKQNQSCSDSTLRKKLRLLSSCFEKANLPYDPVWFRYKIKKRSDDSRRAFNENELKQIYKNTNQFRTTNDNWKYYLPRLALLTGCRLSELAQLTVSDVTLGSEASLSINAVGEGKRTKNNSSVRIIPLNKPASTLLKELTQNKASTQRLFETLTYSQFNGYIGRPSKYFSKLCRDSLNLKGVSFHSFRHTAITYLFNSGIKEELIGQLVGHSTGKLTTGKVYLSGFTDKARRQAMLCLSEYYEKLS
ncbi:tyrosine-type recombinase/integrase [Vibrio owensii]|uniref:tyrosine-type recombinase/integrase n=1 Tax=Vibrio owensii TaxID=696485 RepID=UPI00148C1433|nr:tyrosine-type recombinase/integrase [Vibrio owensii]NOI69605.1 tyrosine-type recombinase/integrase [Vibrio owensii]